MVLELGASAIVALAGWLVTPNINKSIELAHSYTSSSYKWHAGLREALPVLVEDLEEIRALVVDAARSASVCDLAWLWRLKDATDEAEQILDTFQYEIIDANLKHQHRHPVRKAKDSTVDFVKQVIGSKESLKELKKLLERLRGLRQSARDFQQVAARPNPIYRTDTGAEPSTGKLFGYHQEYATLLSSLVPPATGQAATSTLSGDARVVAIIGHGGIGKTELARRAFNHHQKVGDNFKLHIWACVYGKFTEAQLLKEICMSAMIYDGEMNVSSLQKKLTDKVMSKRCLLVLDDVCYDESAASTLSQKKTWDNVLAPLKQHAASGSRVLITTRAEICSTTLDAGARIVLRGLDASAITLLLKKTAFGDERAAVPPDLQGAFDGSIRKLHGSPLAAEEVANTLRDECHRAKWKKHLMSSGHPKGVLQAQLSSYQDLSPQLQRCFAFCSIFPINWRFEPEKLIRMWVALGFVDGSPECGGKKETEEDVARGYFHALLQRSMFEEATVQCESGAAGYVIHEHIHSMLRLVCPTYYHSIDDSSRDDQPKSWETVRHLSVTTSCLHQLKAYPNKLKTVRTLLVFKNTSSSSTSLPTGILRKFKGARVLDFSGTCMTELPKFVGELRHLRYLGLPTTIKRLRAPVTRLLLLQTLGVFGEPKVQEFHELPGNMRSMVNLRHLDLGMEYIAQIGGIGSLEKLQGSVEFHAGRRKEGHAMGELEKLNSLRRTLSIKGLETVTSRQEAESAQLARKEHLEVLELEWGHRSEHDADRSARSDSDVLEGLRPHPNLEILHIGRYVGTATPSWLGDAGVLENLTSLCLRNCTKLQDLPCVGNLPCLKILEIMGLPSVQRIGSAFCCSGAFRSLERMVLDDMPGLLAWDAAVPVAGDVQGTPILLPQLKDVEIIDCPMLSSLWGLLCCRSSLTNLHVDTCPDITATFRRSSFPSLRKLTLVECPNLQFKGE